MIVRQQGATVTVRSARRRAEQMKALQLLIAED